MKKEPKQKPCANNNCTKSFPQFNSTVKVCSTACSIEYAKQKRESNEAKEWRVEKKVRKAKLETVQDLMKRAQKEFNTFIRLRDKDKPCVSCDRKLGAKYDCGHYFSSGGHKSVTFDESNCHAQCIYCNQHLHGNLLNYQIGIKERIGAHELTELNGRAHLEFKPSRDELNELIDKYKQKIKDLNNN